MDQLADGSVRIESPLYNAGVYRKNVSSAASAGVVLCEKPLMGHLTLRGSQQDDSFLSGAAEVLGGPLPTQPLTSANYEDVTIRWISPDQWLLLVDFKRASEVEQQLHQSLSGHYSVVNVSGGQTLLELSGSHASDVLKKGTSLDIHPSHFPVGKVAGSTLAKSSALFCRTGEQSWELVVRRSFADYLWLWLQDAAEEYGLVVQR
ncbi:sarcosine oxidase subunit gamma [Celerinatantimonas sp. YJH-8]|uniref:sarcosine oxidase subunit gamma n=1 Tax=Celerinatantimonas sp. YJH-8 TaxID=3228714 RepID=UPI0038C60591